MTEKGLVRVDERPDAHVESEFAFKSHIASTCWELPRWVTNPNDYYIGELNPKQANELRKHVIRFAETLEQLVVMEMYASEQAHETRIMLKYAKRENTAAIKKREHARKQLQKWKQIIPGL